MNATWGSYMTPYVNREEGRAIDPLLCDDVPVKRDDPLVMWSSCTPL
ncbi:hypothetical protein HMPREF3192_00365 [Atopobium deltae]|uniref:Uncharacterized protein n=1 Tax=Atopobium deltae TaxID=1393034 RepID=A0A133XWH6_9ACTN|nr:hypothetical protein HMPREF3192_00365 [Atopobium deltae]